MTAAVRPKHSIRFHSRSFHAMALAPQQPLADWLAELETWLERSPGFFRGRPIVLDVTGLGLAMGDVVDLTRRLFDRDIQIMGIEGGDPAWRAFGLPPAFVGGGRYVNETARSTAESLARAVEAPKCVESVAAAPPASRAALLIDGALRSGRYIEHIDGDVIVVGSVASGAEIVAGGSIHVYGALRGRAIAGASQPKARIFCRKLEAELVAIEGLYVTADDMEPQLRGRPAQVRLDGDSLTISAQD